MGLIIVDLNGNSRALFSYAGTEPAASSLTGDWAYRTVSLV